MEVGEGFKDGSKKPVPWPHGSSTELRRIGLPDFRQKNNCSDSPRAVFAGPNFPGPAKTAAHKKMEEFFAEGFTFSGFSVN